MSKLKYTYQELEAEILELRMRLSELHEKNKWLLLEKLKAEDIANTQISISENIPAFIAIVDAKTLKYKYVNSQFLIGFNKKREEIIGKHISKIIGEDNTKFAMNYINIVRQGKSTSYINTFNLSNGIRYANVNYVPGFNSKKEVVDIIVLTHDITKIKQSEIELKVAQEKSYEREKYSQMLFNFSPIGFLLTKINGDWVEINTAFANLLGYTVEEALKLNFDKITIKPYIHQELEQLTSLEQNGSYGPYEKEFVHKLGMLIPIRIQGKIIEVEGKRFIWSSVENISEEIESKRLLRKKNKKLKKAKKKAQQSEERFKALHEASSGGIGIHTKGIILDCNQGLADLTGYKVSELIGMNGLMLIAEKCRAEVLQNILSEYELPYEVVGLRKNGEEYPIQIIGRMIPYKNEMVRVVEFRDLTLLKQNEQKLIEQNERYELLNKKLKSTNEKLLVAKEKAEESEKLKSAFLANMSHEIRTPMNSIIGFSQLLKETDPSPEEQLKYIDLITLGGNRLLTLISDIVDVSKIDANQLSINLKPCNINELLDGLHTQFLISNHSTQVILKTTKGLNDSESTIITDCTRLTQILSNLLENALKFTIKGSVEFGYSKTGKVLQFYVKDTGVGIDQKYHEIIFDRFRQVNDDYFKTESGTGLGLSIVKGLIELLKGKIWIESVPKQGTTFFFTIPIA